MNLKNCLNIGSEDSALDYAFMYSVMESCGMNKLSPGWYIKELVARLTAKPCSYVEKVALLPCYNQEINVKINRNLFLTLVESPLNKGGQGCYGKIDGYATLLRQKIIGSPLGHRLRCRYQNSGRAIAPPATSPLPEEEGLGEKVEPSLAKEGRGESKKI